MSQAAQVHHRVYCPSGLALLCMLTRMFACAVLVLQQHQKTLRNHRKCQGSASLCWAQLYIGTMLVALLVKCLGLV
jgi:hypothetical protein